MFFRNLFIGDVNGRRRAIVLLMVWIVATGCLHAGLPLPGQNELPDMEISRQELFVGSELWGLINGGADLYYEYGFDRMALQEFRWQGEEFRLELYRMSSPLAAMGIFSVSVHGCTAGGPFTTGDCASRFQYQLAAGEYYLSLINYSGSARARELSLTIGEKVHALIGKEKTGLPGLFAGDPLEGIADRVRIIRGVLGLRNIIPDEAHLFDGFENFTVWYLDTGIGADRLRLMLIETDAESPGHDPGMLKVRLSEADYVTSGYGDMIIAVSAEGGVEESVRLMEHLSGLQE